MEKIMPSVCIIIPNWNSKEHLRECLLSLSKLDYTNYKIIVVDNGSTDGSVEMVRASFPHVTLLVNSQNLGFAKAVNVGIQASKEEYIALLNNDTVVNPHWLSSLVSAMQRDPKVGLAGGKIYYYELEKVFWGYGGKVDILTGLAWNVGKGEKDAGNYDYDYDYIPACALIIKRETIEKIGFFDEEYFAYFEDTDLNIRARMFGYNVLFIPEAIVWHKALSSKIRSYPKRKLFLFVKSNIRFTMKNFPTLYVLTSLFSQITFYFVFTISFLKSPLYICEILKALIWNLSQSKKTFSQRQIVAHKNILRIRFSELIQNLIRLKSKRFLFPY